jgi:hypothetical protein
MFCLDASYTLSCLYPNVNSVEEYTAYKRADPTQGGTFFSSRWMSYTDSDEQSGDSNKGVGNIGCF